MKLQNFLALLKERKNDFVDAIELFKEATE